ncbi:MAG: LPS export ABC transporter periplasmic protein LptC [Alphaproteobacteria bacterium]|nr:LPS export ABC transporter periplasmic protein LptC [Alphaproteobacteria bacterium]
MNAKRRLRNVFIATAILITLFIMMWPTIQHKLEKSTVSSALDLIQNGAQNINYQGTDSKGVTYNVSAKNLKIVSEHEYLLKEPTLIVTLANKKTIKISTDLLLYNRTKKIATLTGNVHFSTSDDLDLKTTSAKVYVDKRYAEGDEPVECRKGDTMIHASGFKMNDISGDVTFKGRPTFTKLS